MEKRQPEIVEGAANLLSAENITPEQKKAVEILLDAYKRNTYDKWEDRHEMYRDIVDSMVNDSAFEDAELAERMAHNHPTLQQNFMRLCQLFILNMAEKEVYDDRNKAAVEYAKAVLDNVGEEYFPHI